MHTQKPSLMHKPAAADNTLLAYLMMSGIGFLGIIFGLTFYSVNLLAEMANDAVPYNDWALLALAPHKAAMIISYVLGAALLFIYVFAAVGFNYWFRSRMRPSMSLHLNSSLMMICILILNIALLVMFYVATSKKLLAAMCLAWVLMLLLPVCSYYLPVDKFERWLAKAIKSSVLSIAILVLAYGMLIVAMSPYMKFSSLQIINDYMWVPEQTYMSNGLVDNNQFIMQSGIGGLYRDSLIRSVNDLNLEKYHYIPMVDEGKTQILILQNKHKYDYLPSLNLMFIKTEKLTGGDKDIFCSISKSRNCAAIQQYSLGGVSGSSDPITAEFIKKNEYEISGQILAGNFFHHQYAMLGPVNELLLGKTSSQVTYLYGYGNAHILAYLFSHVLPEISFEKFIFTLYSLNLIYFALFMVCCHLIFRDVRYTSLIVASVIGLYLTIGFELIRIAPGFNPMRHFTDMFVLMSFYGYVTARRYNVLYLLMAITFGIFAVYASLEFGLMMMVSLIAASAFYIMFSSKRYLHLLLLIAAAATLGLSIYAQSISTMQNPMSIYSILGVSVAPTKRIILMVLLLIVLAGYAGLIFVAIKRGLFYKPLYVCTFLFFYSQCLWAYFAWYTEKGHLLSTSPIWFLFFVMLGVELSQILLTETKKKNIATLIGGSIAISLLCVGGANYYTQLLQYRSIFKTHLVYQWDFPRANFQSTMNPSVFKEAVELIQQHSQGSAIYLISKYDNLLPFLANKYSAMPYAELSTSLVTENEVNAAVNAIKNNKPRYIFVDSDILSTNIGDIIDPSSLLRRTIDKQLLSAGRVSVLSESKRVFQKVSANYRLIKSGYLVSVYEHI
jgi:hypothetical protein